MNTLIYNTTPGCRLTALIYVFFLVQKVNFAIIELLESFSNFQHLSADTKSRQQEQRKLSKSFI